MEPVNNEINDIDIAARMELFLKVNDEYSSILDQPDNDEYENQEEIQ